MKIYLSSNLSHLAPVRAAGLRDRLGRGFDPVAGSRELTRRINDQRRREETKAAA